MRYNTFISQIKNNEAAVADFHVKKELAVLSALLLIILSNNAVAAEWTVMPRASTGYWDYKLTTPSITVGTFSLPSNTFHATAEILSVGATAFTGGFYFDLYYRGSTSAKSTFTAQNIAYSEEYSGDRKDMALTIGYSITDNFSGYIGYKTGKTSTTGDLNSVSNFDEDGYFIGGTYGQPIANKGIISINAAVADLYGKTYFDASAISPLIHFDTVCRAQGLSYGITWRGNITEKMSYSVSADYQSYDFKNTVDKTYGALPGGPKEKMTTYQIAVSYALPMMH